MRNTVVSLFSLLALTLASCASTDGRVAAARPAAADGRTSIRDYDPAGVLPRESVYAPANAHSDIARPPHEQILPVAHEDDAEVFVGEMLQDAAASGEYDDSMLMSAQEPDSATPIVPPAPGPAEPGIEAEPDDGGLTLGELEELALQNNPTLRQAYALVQQAQGNWLQVGLYPNPIVGYLAGEVGQEGEAGQQGGFFAQDIVTADKLELNRAVTAQDVERARWQAETQRLRVLNHVRILYYQVLGAQRTVETLEELQEIAAQGVEIARQLFDAQQAPRTDVLQAEVEQSGVELLLRNARHQERAARRQLAAVAGVPELPPDPLAGALEGELPPVDFEAEWQQICANSPVLHIGRTMMERARAQLRREQVQPVPDVQVQGAVQQDFATESTIYGAQVGIMLPVHNRNQGNIVAAVADLRRAMDNVTRLELALRHELAEAHRRWEIARTQVELYRDAILPKATETLRLTTEGYRAGEVDFLRVLTARRTYIENYIEYISALADVRMVAAEIDGLLVVGGLDDPSEGAVNPGGGGGGTRPLFITPKTE